VLSATKFLDLVLILPNEEFNLWEWMFITDKNVHNALNSIPKTEDNNFYSPFVNRILPKPSASTAQVPVSFTPSKLRPLLNIPMDQMKSDGFLSFMSHFSDLSYNNTTSAAKVDYKFIEEQLVRDFTESDDSE